MEHYTRKFGRCPTLNKIHHEGTKGHEEKRDYSREKAWAGEDGWEGAKERGCGPTTTAYIYDGDQVIAEYDNSGTLLRKFIYGQALMSR